jgi:hypothetical protein
MNWSKTRLRGGESLTKTTVCIGCREVVDASLEACPSCQQGILVYVDQLDEANSVCDELLLTAALVRAGFRQEDLRLVPVAGSRNEKALAARAQ